MNQDFIQNMFECNFHAGPFATWPKPSINANIRVFNSYRVNSHLLGSFSAREDINIVYMYIVFFSVFTKLIHQSDDTLCIF